MHTTCTCILYTCICVHTLHVQYIHVCLYIHYAGPQESCDLEKKTYIELSPLVVASREGTTRCVECLVGYGADVKSTDALKNTSLHFVLAKKNMKPLSEWTLHLNKVWSFCTAYCFIPTYMYMIIIQSCASSFCSDQ